MPATQAAMHKESSHNRWRQIGMVTLVLLLVGLPVSLWMAGAPPTAEKSYSPYKPVAHAKKPLTRNIGPTLKPMQDLLDLNDTVQLPLHHSLQSSSLPEAPPTIPSSAELPFRVIHSGQIFSTRRPSKQEQERLRLALEDYAQERNGTLFFDADGCFLPQSLR